MQKKSRSTPAQLQIFENGARSAHAPEILELDPELELKFRSGPTTGPDHILGRTQKSSIQKILLFHGARIFFYHLGP